MFGLDKYYVLLGCSLVAFVLCLIVAFKSKGKMTKVLSLNFCVLFFLISVLEIFFLISLTFTGHGTEIVGTYKESHQRPHKILGYAAKINTALTARKHNKGETIYDVTYTTNDKGLRIPPFYDPASEKASVGFFGGSFTFGEGVEDHETLPYRVGEYTGRNVYNFGFHGYGPHQMLAAWEQGLVRETVATDKLTFVYQIIPEHILRSAGYSSWDDHGPKYIYSEEEGLKFVGPFSEGKNLITEFIKKSFLYKKYFANRIPEISQNDIDLFLNIISSSRDYLKREFVKSGFHVILWPAQSKHFEPYYKIIQDGLSEKGINVHLITDILPNFLENVSQYQIHPLDKHPNPSAFDIIAQYIAVEIKGD